jgi:hypothetical protein
MKDWIELHCPPGKQIEDLTPAELKPLIWEVWDAVLEWWLKELAHGMPGRLKKCIELNGHDVPY